MKSGLERNSPQWRRRRHRWRSRSPSRSPSPSHVRSKPRSPSPTMNGDDFEGQTRPRAYMKQVKLHPSGCQQWSSQVVAGGGIYMAYASTLTTYVYDVRDYSLLTVLGGNDCNIHSLLWHPQNPHRLVVFSTDGRGSEWDVRSEKRTAEFYVGRTPACTDWDSSDDPSLAVVVQECNTVYLIRTGSSDGQGARKTSCSRRSLKDPSLSATCTKWSRCSPGTLAIGWSDGRLSFYEPTAVTSSTATTSNSKMRVVYPKENESVVDLRHDPNGGSYLLVAYASGSVVLWDTSAHSCISSFEKCAVGLVGVRWMAWAPGNFLALSSKTGVARVFNIAQNKAIGIVRLGDTGSGVRDMAWLPVQAASGSTSAARTGPTAICGFRDGSLSVANVGFQYNRNGIGCSGNKSGLDGRSSLGDRALLWASKAAHIETVFACAHKPGDENTLATGSYGSSVKIWHAPTMDLKITLTGQTGAIYSVSWSLDGERVASAAGDGSVWVFDAESGKALRRLNLHSRASHRVQWDPFHPTRLASAGADRALVVFGETGAVERTYLHPAALFGCDWCPSCPDTIATGCMDGNIRIFDVSYRAGFEPRYILSGHTRRVFSVTWSPLLHATLASGSDDTTILVWCLGAGSLPRPNPTDGPRQVSPTAVLRGHTSNVRPLHWNSEIPWLLLSGSWDGTIRAWDIRRAGVGSEDFPALSRGETANDRLRENNNHSSVRPEREACIAVMNDHVADVYGLSAANGRPFLYVSASRDTTLRHFTLEGIVSSLKVKATVGNSLANCQGETKESMRPGKAPALCGQASKALQAKLHVPRQGNCAPGETSRLLFDFFWGSDGIDDFWEMIRWVAAAAEGRVGDGHPVDYDTQKQQQREWAIDRNTLNNVSDHAVGGAHAGNATDGSATSGLSSVKTSASRAVPPRLRPVPKGLMVVEERVIHRNARRESAKALAELLDQSTAFLVQDRRLGRRDRLQRATLQYLAAGDLRSSCETFLKLDRWERALAVAPGVGVDYWTSLAERYDEFLRCEGCVNGPVRGGSGGGQDGSDDTITMTVSLSLAIGKPLEALKILQGSDEAFTLAVSIADGAYPPSILAGVYGEGESVARDIPRASISEQDRGDTKEAAGDRRRRLEQDQRGGEAEAKLLELLDKQSTKLRVEGARDTRGASGSNDVKRTTSSNKDVEEDGDEGEGKAPPKDEQNDARHKSPGVGNSNSRWTAKHCPNQNALCHKQRQSATAALHDMTTSKAETRFRASQPALAAATLLSTSDGSRTTTAPAVALLLRGDEPELAYAAARALRFPARELNPLMREMARRAEAWGDPNLAIELLLEAGGDDHDDDIEMDDRCGGRVSAGSDKRGGGFSRVASDGAFGGSRHGYWPARWYGVGGGDAGATGAAFVALRAGAVWEGVGRSLGLNAGGSHHDVPSLRSKASYLEDADAALRRGRDIEAVQSLVLAGSLQRAAEHAAGFLRDTLTAPLLSQRALTAALAVTRALGSGRSLADKRFPARLRKEVLAYASYVGALEASVRRYHSVVAPLLRNCAVLVQAVEHFHETKNDVDSTNRDNVSRRRRRQEEGDIEADEKSAECHSTLSSADDNVSDENDGSSTHADKELRPRLTTTATTVPSSGVFPTCMSTGALVLHAIQHLTVSPHCDSSMTADGGGGGLEDGRTAHTGSQAYEKEVALEIAWRIRDEEQAGVSSEQLKAIDDVLSDAQRRLRVGDDTSVYGTKRRATAQSRLPSSFVSEGKTREEDGNDAHKKDNAGGEPHTRSIIAGEGSANTPHAATREVVEDELARTRRLAGNKYASSPPRQCFTRREEINVSGSQLPSCRRHERVSWRAGLQASTTNEMLDASVKAGSSSNFGQQTWPVPRGATFLLEDGQTEIGLSNAVMWAKVNPFSPLNTGCRIMPF